MRRRRKMRRSMHKYGRSMSVVVVGAYMMHE
jgi:hypothetical protein